MVLRCDGIELNTIRFWRGIDQGIPVRPMLTCWSIFLSIFLLRGWGSSGRVICLLGLCVTREVIEVFVFIGGF